MNDEEFLENLLTVPSIYRTKISTTGDKICFGWKNIHPNVDVFYIDLKGKAEPAALTETKETTIPLDFYPKENAVLVSEDKSRNERHRIFRVNLNEPKNMIPITEDDPEYFLRWGDIHPNEKWIIYGANFDFDKKKEIEPTWMHKQDLNTNEIITIAKPTKPAWTYPALNKNGTHIIYRRKEFHPKGVQMWLADFEGSDDREILNFGEQARTSGDWLPDSKRMVFLTDSKGEELQNYYSVGIFNTENNDIEWIIDDSKRNIEYITVPKFGNYILVYEIERTKTKTTVIDLESMKQIPLPSITGNLSLISPVINNEWIGYHYSSTQPIDIVKLKLGEVQQKDLVSLTNIWRRSKLGKEQFTAATDFDWKGKDGLPIHGWIYKPKNPNGKVIVYVHGGPSAHSEDEINAQIQYYAHRGFFVLDPNYRGSTGYSYEFEDAIRKNGWGSDEQYDILAGIKALIEKGYAEKGKIGITGTSYGGYSSWWAITKAPKELIAASAPICGMTDLVVDYQTTRPDLRPYSEQMLGGNPDEVPEVYHERSPINFVQNINGTLLIIQGAQDPNVTPKNVDEVKKRLDLHSKEYDLLVFEDEGHGIIKTKNQKILFKRIADFFEKAL